MFKKNDPNSFTVYHSLYDGGNLKPIGYLVADYYVTKYDNVQVQNSASVNQNSEQNFLLHCTQRIVINNQLSIRPNQNINSYSNYPALINTSLNLNRSPINGKVDNNGLNIEIVNYSPHTVNTQIQQSGSVGDSNGKTQTTSRSNTTGSSTSETNSFGATVSLGLTELSDSTSYNYEHSSTFSRDHSYTHGTDSSSSKSKDSSYSDSMSIKDWGAYGMIDPTSQSPNWIFGQEYPWNAIECNQLKNSAASPSFKPVPNPNNDNQQQLMVPMEMLARLYDGTCVYPPSQLSLFGVNFVMKALWLINVENDVPCDVTITHNIALSTASHMLDATGKQVQIYMDTTGATLQCRPGKIISNLNLTLMGLDVLGLPNKPAIIGFIPRQFVVNPADGPFKIISTANTLLIEDTTDYGNPVLYPATTYFTATDSALIASPPSGPLSVALYFKVIDTINDYSLYVKHWITGTEGVKLTITINYHSTKDPGYTIIKFVTTQEAEGGENNLLTIALRKQDFSSVDFHDYLQLGLNKIEISIEAIDGKSKGFNYQLRAISVEKTTI